MLYGKDSYLKVVLESDLIDLSGNKNLNTIEWEAAVDPGTTVQLQTRSGNELIENLLYFDSDGSPIEPVGDPVKAKRNYDRKPSSKQGEIKSFFSAGGDWSAWSDAYRASGGDDHLTQSARVHAGQGDAAVGQSEVGGIASDHQSQSVPTRSPIVWSVRSGPRWCRRLASLRMSHFMCARPSVRRLSSSTELRIEATGGTVMELIEARIGSDDEFARDEPTVYLSEALEVIDGPSNTIQFRLPEPVDEGVDLLEIRFRPTTFSTNTDFTVFGQDSNTLRSVAAC